jgi:hypothetical protein
MMFPELEPVLLVGYFGRRTANFVPFARVVAR